MGNRLMCYPNILHLLAHQHAIPLERAHQLWDQATVHSTTPVGLTPDDTPEWESVMSSFLESIRCEARALRSGFILETCYSICGRLVDYDANRRVPTNSPHDHLATPFLDYRTRAIDSVNSFEAAKQEYAVSSADQHELVKIGKDMRAGSTWSPALPRLAKK